MFTKEDIRYMKKALRLSAKGAGICSPDPMVGAVIVKDGIEIATGYHLQQGTPHAEAVALRKAGEAARGSTVYVSLEPCCHWGNNPPCVLDIISHGVKRVVVAMRDPNPLVKQCNSEKILHDAGITVEYGCCEAEALKLNEFFVKHITTGKPFVIMKAAMTLDGKIATRTRDSKWITGEPSRKLVHVLRSQVDAVMVGIGTVLADDPVLTARNVKYFKQPARVVVDSNARLPLDSKLITTINEAPLILIVSEHADNNKLDQLIIAGVQVIKLSSDNGEININDILLELGKRKIMSILLEGGGSLNYSFLQSGQVDKAMYFVAPKFVGGKDALTPIEGAGLPLISDAYLLRDVHVRKIGQDILIQGMFQTSQ